MNPADRAGVLPGVSALVIAQKAAGIIRRCLDSLGFADEIVVVDAVRVLKLLCGQDLLAATTAM